MVGRRLLALLLLLTLLAGCRTAELGTSPALDPRLETLTAEPLDGGLMLDAAPAASWQELRVGRAGRGDIIVRIQIVVTPREQL
jgi:hypothetical protein